MELCFGNKKGYCDLLINKGQLKRKCDNPKECAFYKTQQQFEDDRKKAAEDYKRRTGVRR